MRSQQFGPYALLLAALVFFCTLLPIVEQGGVGASFVKIGFTVVLLSGIAVARGNRAVLGVALFLVFANLVVQWGADAISADENLQQLLRSAVAAPYLGYLIAVLVRSLLAQKEATADTVLGGINVYVLLALAFMELHLFMERLEPGSYVKGGVALSAEGSLPHGTLFTTMFYFSFVTLTTLGYGDIAPARPVSQFLCSAEAVIGQLYVAIFIGGLVALRINDLRNERESSPS